MSKKKIDKDRETVEFLISTIFPKARRRKLKKEYQPNLENVDSEGEEQVEFWSKANLDSVDDSKEAFVEVWRRASRELIPVSEAAKMRGISRISMYDLIERGRLHVIELGGHKFVIRKEVQLFERAKPGPARKEQ